jgi:hypothetical protein
MSGKSTYVYNQIWQSTNTTPVPSRQRGVSDLCRDLWLRMMNRPIAQHDEEAPLDASWQAMHSKQCCPYRWIWILTNWVFE